MVGFILMPSAVGHRKNGVGVFATHTVSKGETFGAYHCLLVHSDGSEEGPSRIVRSGDFRSFDMHIDPMHYTIS